MTKKAVLSASARVFVRQARATPEGQDPRSHEIFQRLHACMFGRGNFPFCKGDKTLPLRERRKMLREVDDLHRSGVAWPHWRVGPYDDAIDDFGLVPFIVRVDPDECRKPSKRPDHLPYCVEW
ncbi:MAG TPA: hypothetical protein VFA29_12595, partial [Candidatus Baltobacteraceae bacterium]|nr:hypothetical protein [Candidatus Baltobacteraceae bacterium]